MYLLQYNTEKTDKGDIQNANFVISQTNLGCDHSLESSLRDDSNEWSQCRFG